MAGIDERGMETTPTIESLQQENKTLRKQARLLERRLTETEQMLSMMNNVSKNVSQMSAYMEKEILQREKYLNMLLDNCKDFFILLNEQLEITYCSRNFAELMRQIGFNELRGQNYQVVVRHFAGKQHKGNALERLKRLREGETAGEAVEEIDFTMNGNPRKYTVFAAPMYDENHAFNGVLVCYSDVTDLVAARETAEESVKAKSAFLARMSHEIRTPMNAIIGLSKLTLREELSGFVRSYCSDVHSAANNLLGIINDILDFSKIESGKLEIVTAEYHFSSLVNDVITIIRMRLGESPIRFVTDIAENIPGRLIGDEIRIRQILLNLLSNAAKYTREGQITFIMKADIGKDGHVTLKAEITDTGIGIKTEDMGKLFGNFNRLDMEKNKHVEGTGLGLAITLNLCRQMGGDITVESEYGKGSTFTALIPQRAEDLTPFSAVIDVDTAVKKEEWEAKYTAPSVRVLIVDDVSMNLTVAEGLVSPYEIQVDTCLNGTEAINMVKRHDYDIVFMDHMMPGMDGVEATALIRAWEKDSLENVSGEPRRRLPIIALTANAVSGMREMFLSKGFDDYLSKPIEIPKLDETLAKWIPENKKLKNVSANGAAGGAKGTNTTTQENFSIPGVDVQMGISMTGGTEKAYRKVLSQFFKDAEARLPLFVKFCEAKQLSVETDISALTINAHALKSAAGTIGAEEVSHLAAELEAAGKAGNLAVIAKKLPRFYARLAELIESIKKEEEKNLSAEPVVQNYANGERDNSVYKEKLSLLKAALETKNMQEIDALLAEIETMTLDMEMQNEVNTLGDYVLMVEYEKAAQSINTIINTYRD